ncbi:hypothetical protein HY524_00535 [Candidatus Berkelbacteria bacterium]|nr:hypothetical protein [Candidatus Berkelbacteria bacterium]
MTATQHRFVYSFVALLLVSLTLSGCSLGKKTSDTSTSSTTQNQSTSDTQQPSPTGDPNSLTGLLPSSINTKVTTNLNLATNAAHAWQSDAVLTYVSVELPATLAPDSGNEVYVFGSAADNTNWWTYSIAQDTGKFVRALIPREDYLGATLDPVNTNYWNMNYVEALQLAESNGGADFRSKNASTRVTIFLSQRAPRGWLWWTVEYTAASGEQLTLLVNPNRGEVVNEAGDEVAPAKATTPSSSQNETPATNASESGAISS